MWVSQSSSVEESALQLIEGLLGLIGPSKRCVLTSQSRQRFGDSSKVLHEAAVITGQAEKGTNITQTMRSGPISDGIKLSWLRFNTVGRNQVAKELNGRLEEDALGRLSFQTVLSKSGKDCIETFSCSGLLAKTTMSSK